MMSETLKRVGVGVPQAEILKSIEHLARAARSQQLFELDELLTEVLADLFAKPASPVTDEAVSVA